MAVTLSGRLPPITNRHGPATKSRSHDNREWLTLVPQRPFVSVRLRPIWCRSKPFSKGLYKSAVRGRLAMTKRKFTERFAHASEITNPAFNIRQMLNHHLVRTRAGVLGMVGQFQQSSNFVHREAKFAATAHERQSLHGSGIVTPVPIIAARRRGQQFYPFVITDCFDVHARQVAQHSDGISGVHCLTL
jgi:hypothetical protein